MPNTDLPVYNPNPNPYPNPSPNPNPYCALSPVAEIKKQMDAGVNIFCVCSYSVLSYIIIARKDISITAPYHHTIMLALFAIVTSLCSNYNAEAQPLELSNVVMIEQRT